MMPPVRGPDRLDPAVTSERAEAALWRSRAMINNSAVAIGRAHRSLTNSTASIALARQSLQATWRRVMFHHDDRSSSVSVETEIAVRERLHDMTVRYLRDRLIVPLLDDALDALMLITGAPLGNVQLADDRRGILTIVTQQGFRKDFLDFFAEVRLDGSACGEARRNRRRVIVGDVATDPLFTPESRRVVLDAGARAVQSTPLVSSEGRVLAVLSTHCRQPGTPSPRALRIVDTYARQISALLDGDNEPRRRGPTGGRVMRTPGARRPG